MIYIYKVMVPGLELSLTSPTTNVIVMDQNYEILSETYSNYQTLITIRH